MEIIMMISEEEIKKFHSKVDEVLSKTEVYYNAYGNFTLSFNSLIRIFDKKEVTLFEGSYYRLVEIEFFKLFDSEDTIDDFHYEIKSSKFGWIPTHPQFQSELKKKFRKLRKQRTNIRKIDGSEFIALVA